MHEAKQHTYNCFITPTYDNDHLPADRNLNHRHFQLFIKKLRSAIDRQRERLQSGTYTTRPESKTILIDPELQDSKAQIKYHMCGEYGPKNGRPHYHANMFGVDFADKKPWRTSDSGHKLYMSETLNKIWGNGDCPIGQLNWQTAAYTARYSMKKAGEKQKQKQEILDVTTGQIITRTAEYQKMSRGGRTGYGIAGTWIRQYTKDIYPRGTVLVNGQQVTAPKYYDNYLKTLDEDAYAKLKLQRREQVKDDNGITRARLEAKETVTKAKLAFLKRNGEF